MALPVPTTLSPSKVSSFKDCALAFRFSAIDRIPEPTSPAMARGTLVHAALERLFGLEPDDRTVDAALGCLADATAAMDGPDGELAELDLADDERATFLGQAEQLVRNYFLLEDPRRIRPIGLELRLQAPVGDHALVGIIDRLELDEDGELLVTDYKTGRAPSDRYEQSKMGGIHFYSLLCEELLGRRPARIQLLHLAEPVVITATPTDQSTRGLRTRVGAVWQAVTQACEREDFRPKPGPLCRWCSFQQWCPQFGGDPARAAADAEAGVRPVALAAQAS
ncbi:PD-(D/E)XK nuclease family protein [Iamia majanohamensis]|uniref:PD-(D/E)XK nuclease family protein n=1 Tax=Iamia majanohamensis TaxID=467976 RepID=A0AAE9Y7M6_9ACTN|nr:PD-(D/E)XK nuclease family protein [Iamia majanohamensis]WCO65923.1 PD-(D/E)XK nuclease family protein [Iamia majanohamensis]